MAIQHYENPEVIQEYNPSPAEQVELATAQADALKGVVNRQQLFKNISGKKYLLAEAWQTITAFDNASFETEYCRPIKDDEGKTEAYEAKVNITKNGQVMASGVMVCGFDDFPCRGKSGYAQHRAAQSAAQTWAGAKAARMKYAWVVTMAGYEPTPAEEMHQDNTQRPVQPPQEPRPSRPRRPAPKSSEGKLKQLDEARFDDGKEVYTPDQIAAFICDTYGEEATARTLDDSQIDYVIDAMLAQQIGGETEDTSGTELPSSPEGPLF